MRGLLAQTSNQVDSTASAQRFVQSFYDWYTPIARRTIMSDTGGAQIAVKRQAEVFSRELLDALRADLTARAKGEEGLDFDPFLFSQDTPCEHYQADRVLRQRDSYRVDVRAICDGEPADSAHVAAELRPSGGSWQFVNFYYSPAPTPDDLIGVLKGLSEERRKP